MKATRITTFRGKEATLSEIAEALGLSYQLVWNRHVRFGETGDEIEHGKRKPGKKAKPYECNGEALTIEEWAKKLGAKEHAIRERISRRGTPYAGARGKSPKLYNGKTIPELAEEHGIDAYLVYNRIRKGKTLEEALLPPKKAQIIDGVPVQEIAKRNGVSRQLLSLRLKGGWTPEDAISKPPKRYRQNDEI